MLKTEGRICSSPFCIKFDSHPWQVCQVVIVVQAACGKNTLMVCNSDKENHVTSLLWGEGNREVATDPHRKCANLAGVALCLRVDRQEEQRTYVASTAASHLYSSSLLLMRYLGNKQVIVIYGIVCRWTQSMSKSGKIDAHHARSESGYSVWRQWRHSPSALVLMLAYFFSFFYLPISFLFFLIFLFFFFLTLWALHLILYFCLLCATARFTLNDLIINFFFRV